MKKVILSIASTIIFMSFTLAQSEVDALRYSQNYYGGTARSMAMGGAFGALGADLSAISYNPAGIALYRANEFSITPTWYINDVDADYFNQTNNDRKYNFNFNNIGVVGTYLVNDFVYKTNENQTGWMNTNFAVGYNRLNNFHSNVLIEGNNTTSSIVNTYILDHFLSGDFDFIGIESAADLVFDSDPGDAINYTTDFNGSAFGQLQSKSIRTKGSMGEYYFAFGANYSHKLYLGGSIGIQSVRYEENADHDEVDQDNSIPNFVSMNFHEHLETRGSGYNFKFGMIYRPIDLVRFGVSVHTPTFFNLEDEYYAEIESLIDYQEGTFSNYEKSKILHTKYEVTTPMKAMTSLAFIIGKFGLVSVDYEFVDYSTIRMRSDKESYSDINKIIADRYKATGNLRVGAEFKNGPFSLRAGYGFYGSPYASNDLNSGTSYSSYSGGLGIRDENFFFDLAYVHSTISEKYFLYGEQSAEANLDSKRNKIMATIGVRF